MADARKQDKQAQTREDRLRAALKANLARRKAQAKARRPEKAETQADKDR